MFTPQSPPVTPPPEAKQENAKPTSGGTNAQILFHYAECTNCHNLLPISTNTEKYFAILAKEPSTAFGLGERCARCGADSWMIVRG